MYTLLLLHIDRKRPLSEMYMYILFSSSNACVWVVAGRWPISHMQISDKLIYILQRLKCTLLFTAQWILISFTCLLYKLTLTHRLVIHLKHDWKMFFFLISAKFYIIQVTVKLFSKTLMFQFENLFQCFPWLFSYINLRKFPSSVTGVSLPLLWRFCYKTFSYIASTVQ